MSKLDRQQVEDILRLTPIQEGILFHYLKDPTSEEYVEQLSIELMGNMDEGHVKKAWELVIQTNEILRTVFRWEKVKAPVQIILKEHPVQWTFHDVQEHSDSEKEALLTKIQQQERHKKFDLQEVPFRISLCRLEKEKHVLTIHHHHILYDGWSNGLLLKEFWDAYACVSQGKTYSLPRKKTYKEFVKFIQGQDSERQQHFWQNYLAGFDAQRSLFATPLNHESNRERKNREKSIRLDKEPLEQFARTHEVTLASLIYSAWGILLQKYKNSSDVLFGTTVSGRSGAFPGIEDLIGLFINTIPLRVTYQQDETVAELVQRIHHTLQNRSAMDNTPLSDIKKYSELDERNTLFDTIVVFENYPLDQALQHRHGEHSAGMSFGSYSATEVTHYDLTLSVMAFDEIEIGFSYNEAVVDSAVINRMVTHLPMILHQIVNYPERDLTQLEMITPEEKDQILSHFNHTEVASPHSLRVIEQFEQQVKKEPKNVALMFEGQGITYQELERRANRLGNTLIHRGVKPGEIVALLTSPSIEMIVGILAILKIGSAYLPLDPAYPDTRKAYLLQDSGVQYLLTQQTLAEESPVIKEILSTDQLVMIDDPTSFAREESLPEFSYDARDLFCVFYTSGTTGQPKGVMIDNRSVLNLVHWFGREYQVNHHTHVLQLSSYTVDPSLEDIFGTLLHGGTLHIAEPDVLWNRQAFCDYVDQHQIHLVNFIPTVLKELLPSDRKLASLQTVISGSEKLDDGMKNDLIQKGYQLYNNYGPTETTVDALSQRCTEAKVSLGRPIANMRCYIMDAHHQLAPIGVEGEIYIAGAGVSQGYLNRPHLTQERFLQDPYYPGERMYRTGDLGKWLADGQIEWIGRMDHQVKIRGYRIELGEIQNQCYQYEYVKDAVVIDLLNDSGKKVLCAYIVGDQLIDERHFRDDLSSRLPSYMVPTHIMQLDRLPLTATGKVDRRALPRPMKRIGNEYVAPRNEVENELVQIWSTVLGRAEEEIGIEDNFFELGGDSILSIQIAGKAMQKGIQLSVNQMFHYQTIADLARVVQYQQMDELEEGDTPEGEVPLTPIQKWFFEQKIPNIHHWNQAVFLETPPGTQAEGLRESFATLIDSHDSFRLRYRKQNGSWVQAYSATGDHGQLHVYDVSNLSSHVRDERMKSTMDHLQRSLHIEEGPLIQAAFFYGGEEESGQLFITAHHLIVDGYSWRVILEDLHHFYEQWERHGAITPSRKTLSFQKWSEHVTDYAQSVGIHEEMSYWLKETETSVVTIPVDKGEGLNSEGSAHILSCLLKEEETHQLVYDIHSSFHTRVEEILLTALSCTLAEWTGQILVDLEGHGREKLMHDHDVSRTIGWFTSVFPLVLGKCHGKGDLAAQIKGVKEQFRGIPRGGIGYEILYYLGKEDLQEQLTSKPRAPFSFNYLGQFDQRAQKDSRFTLTDLPTGSSRDEKALRSHLIEMDCMIVNGELRMDWKYSIHKHEEKTIQQLADRYLGHLKRIMQCCMEQEKVHFTPSDFPLARLQQKDLDNWMEQSVEIDDIYALSPVQQSMVFHHIYSPESSVTVEQIVFTIKSELDMEAFEWVWQQIAARHDSMRASYHWKGMQEPIQLIHPTVNVPFSFIDWSRLQEDEQQNKWNHLLKEDRKQGFDLSIAPLMRISVVKKSDAHFDVIWTHHHLQLDGWCNSILLKEIGELYEGYRSGQSIALPEAIPFKNYMEWYHHQDMEDAEKYWRESLKDFRTPIRFNSIFPTKAVPKEASPFGYVRGDIPETIQQQMKAYAKQHRITVNTIVQGAWALLLHRYSGEEDIVFGATSSGRPADLEGSEAMIGCFMNTLPFRIHATATEPLSSWLQEIQRKQAQMRQFEYTPLADIRSWSDAPRNSALYDLYESIVIFENYPFDLALKEGLGTLQVESMQVEEQLDYPLTVYCNLQPHFHVKLLFDYRYVDQKEADRLLRHLIEIIQEMIQADHATLEEISMLTDEEVDQLIHRNNETAMDYPKEAVFTDLFAKQVRLHPHHPAVMQEEQQLSYEELNIRSNQLAHRLIQLGVGPDVPVGVYMERSLEMMVGIVGILKAGGAFLPMDAEYPSERIHMMLEDGKVPVLLTQQRLQGKIRYDGAILCLDPYGMEERVVSPSQPMEQPRPRIEPHQLAYVIYTSGSSGKPKGVMMSHEACVSHALDMMERYQLTPQDRVLQFSSISFDISLEQMLSTMAAGATLVLRDKEIWTPYQFSQKCEEYGLTLVNLPTSYWGEVCQEWYHRPEIIPREKLRLVVVGGEQMPPEKVALWEKLPCDHILFLNAYGPAETAMTSTLFHVSGHGKKSADLRFIPVGKPLANRRIYILGENMQLLPQGVKGEICIGGIPLARGYLGNEDLTAQQFINDPFVQGEGDRLYRTGDLGRLLPDGNIEVLGRKDAQTKIRGHRIDIGEVEAVLNQSDWVRDAVVVVKDDARKDKMLVAYYVSTPLMDEGTLHLKEQTRQILPEYMVPSYFIQLPRLPMSPNGKIDRKELESRVISRETTEVYVPPENDVQQRLVKIWEKVLGVTRVGIDDSFFESGGQSLNAITLVSEIHREFEVELPLIKVFESPTVRELSLLIEENVVLYSRYVSIMPVGNQAYYESAAAQKRLYLVHEMSEERTRYNMPGAVILDGVIDYKRLEESFKQLVDRHDGLRTSFSQQGEKVMQRVCEENEFTLEPIPENGSDVEDYIQAFIRPFELAVAPLFRVGVVQLSADQVLLLYDMHHIISDGLSISILMKEFASLYEGLELPEQPLQYRDFAAWQNQGIATGAIQSQEDFWLQTFAGEIPLLDLPTDFLRTERGSMAGDEVVFSLKNESTVKLHRRALAQGTTLFSLLLSAFHVLLHKYTGQRDIVVGSPVVGRRHAALENIVGMFVNTLALRNQVGAGDTLNQFIDQVTTHAIQALENQDYPFEMLVEKLDIERDFNRNPLFDVMFAFENVDRNRIQLRDVDVLPYAMKEHAAKFDLELKVTEFEGELTFTLQFRKSLFLKETMERMAGHLKRILVIMMTDQNPFIDEIDLLSQSERNWLSHINDTTRDYPSEKTLKDLFEEQVVRHPRHTAVVCGTQKITYEVLNQRANQLANHLITQGAKTGMVIGLMAEPSLEMIIGLWAVIKSGATYLPLDPELPEERIHWMLEKSHASFLLKQGDGLAIESFAGNTIMIDQEWMEQGNIGNPDTRVLPEDPIYLIFTSGTTGMPKGVPVKHQSLVNYLTWFSRTAGIRTGDKTFLLSSIAFDLGYTALYSALLNGGELHLAPKDFYVQPQNLLPYLHKHQISYLKLTPSLFSMIVNGIQENRENLPLALRLVVLGGEEINLADLVTFHRRYPEVQWLNHYGPTEATVGVIAHPLQVKEGLPPMKAVIGKPIDNHQIYLLNPEGKPVPVGVIGEICIAGVGLTEGYLGDHDGFNHERFVEGTIWGPEPIRYYRTGDLGRYTATGDIQFMGRLDQQLKIRGFRVEPEEVASVLLQHEGVREAIVVAKRNDTSMPQLHAYLVANEKLDSQAVRRYLTQRIPYYMMPVSFVQLERLPLTLNGKIDVQKLLSRSDEVATSMKSEEPLGYIEQTVADIWEEVLGVKGIGADDHFFAWGGDSLKAMLVIAAIQKRLQVNLLLREIFYAPTVRELAQSIKQAAQQRIYSELKPIADGDTYALSSAQQRLYTLNHMDGIGTAYHLPRVMVVEGELDHHRVQQAFDKLIHRHEALRTSFEIVKGEVRQRIHAQANLSFQYRDMTQEWMLDPTFEMDEGLQEMVEQFVQPFDLSQAPLLRVEWIRIAQDRHVLMTDMHHLIADGYSIQLLIREWMALYQGQSLPENRYQYKDFASWQNEFLQSEGSQVQEKYWLDHLSGELPVLTMPTDFPRPVLQSFAGDRILFQAGESLKNKIEELCIATDTTLYMVLFAAYNTLLAKYSAQEELIVGSPVLGRTHADLQSIIGMFVNTLAIRSYPAKDKSFKEYVAEVKENLLQAYENQDYPFDRLVDRLEMKRDPSRNPVFSTLLALQESYKEEEDAIPFKTIEYRNSISKFDLSLYGEKGERDLHFEFEFATKLFTNRTVQQLSQDYLAILEAVTRDATITLDAIPIEGLSVENTEIEEVIFDFS
ncbi:non-ribosomal peptide synthetase [Marininema halotolerans]|uniref:Iturin family lipopeptide synthetase B n=1 Tax=Marininema halotolerans TaxID=1155944 RepID=A0A1I6Q2G8_9BACL|nr:non-ribosomal peptide synthetase [Marininema halotolerans]SFS46604.1 iturin family lipopeptide synthetase B [Marininema halotolerans]